MFDPNFINGKKCKWSLDPPFFQPDQPFKIPGTALDLVTISNFVCAY